MVLITFNWKLFVFKYTNTLEKGSIFLVGRIPLPDVHKIRIICLLFNKFLRNFTNLSGNKFPTQYIQIKLILGSNFYDKMQLYGILGQPSYMLSFQTNMIKLYLSVICLFLSVISLFGFREFVLNNHMEAQGKQH